MATSSEPKSITKTQQQSKAKTSSTGYLREIVDNYVIVWLDSNLDFSNTENQELIRQLRSMVNTIKILTDINQCIEFLEQMKNETIFLVISDRFIQHIASLEELFQQLNSIYVLCNQKSIYDEIIKTYHKGRGIFTEIKFLCSQLRQDIHQLNNNLIPTSIIPASWTNNPNEIEPTFMCCQLLKENLLTIEYDIQSSCHELVEFCRSRNVHENDPLIDEFERQYNRDLVIWWYTRECFLFKMVNQALRTFDGKTIMKMSFFIRDLHEKITEIHSKLHINENSLILYRGMTLPNDIFRQWKKNEGDLIVFNSFLSTTSKIGIAMNFSNQNDQDTRILLEIKMNPSISSVPFVKLNANMTEFPDEEEWLFSIGTVFRIDEVKEAPENLWNFHLSSTSNRDLQLKRLTDHMRISLGEGDGWRRLGQLMIKTGQFDEALDIYQMLIKNIDQNNKSENAFLHNQLGYVYKQKGLLEKAFDHYKESLKIYQTYMSNVDPRLSSTYSNIGTILKSLHDFNGALKYFELVLEIDRAVPKPNQLEIAIDHNNIGSVLDDQGKYAEALKSYEQALDIKLTYLPRYHPSLANTYSNIGLIHRKMGDYSTALAFYRKTLENQKKSLPPNHPSLITTHKKLAIVLEELHQYQEALEHVQQASQITDNRRELPHSLKEELRQYVDKLKQKI